MLLPCQQQHLSISRRISETLSLWLIRAVFDWVGCKIYTFL